MSFEIPGVLWRRDPLGAEVPLVFDSPHSGSHYPEDFRFSCAFDLLRTAEDTYVDELYAAAPELGATLIGAVFPRSYLDANRAADDLDTALVEEPWPFALSPSHKTRAGLGPSMSNLAAKSASPETKMVLTRPSISSAKPDISITAGAMKALCSVGSSIVAVGD